MRRKRSKKPASSNTDTNSGQKPDPTVFSYVAAEIKESRLHPAVQAWIDEIPDKDQEWNEGDFSEWLALIESSIRRAHKLPKPT